MNYDPRTPLKIFAPEKFEPGRTVYVLIHKDQSHIASLPNGEADWSYSEVDMTLRKQILEKDFQNSNYEVITLAKALVAVSNKQDEIEMAWKPVMERIRKHRKLEERWELYSAAKKKMGPHPLRFDTALRKILKID